MARLSIVLVLGVLAAACNPVQKPIASGSEIPNDSAAVCTSHCAAMGLRMSAVVVISNSVGCVCESGTAAPGMSATGGAAAAGGAVIAAQVAAAQQRQASNNAAAAGAK